MKPSARESPDAFGQGSRLGCALTLRLIWVRPRGRPWTSRGDEPGQLAGSAAAASISEPAIPSGVDECPEQPDRALRGDPSFLNVVRIEVITTLTASSTPGMP